MASSITLAGESLKAQKQGAHEVLEIRNFVLALVPGLDPNNPIDRSAGLPPAEQIVGTWPYTQKGFVDPNRVVYSLMLGSDIGDFDWNWIGLTTAEGTLFAVSTVPVQQKRRNIPPLQTGNNVTRNFMLAFDGAQELTAITVDAETWQHDFTEALRAKEPTIPPGKSTDFWTGNKTWSDLATAVRSVVLTGLSTATSSAVAATDTLLAALGKLQAQITSLGNNKLDKTATAAAATKLATARKINGVNFDGSSDISISAPANGGTSAACSGNAATATKLATARKINGINFDGTADITLPASAQGYTQLFSGKGWCKLPNGLILQWGTADPAYNGNTHHDLNVTLPTTFPGAILACGVSLRTGFTWDGALGHTGAAPLSTSQIRIRSAGATTARPGVQWWAIGY